MSNILRCPTCGGRKRILGLGLIKKDCDTCMGIGWIKDVIEEENSSKKRRGKKINDEKENA